ncbi:hypothetical protein [Methylobacter luteus]|uniref:hypothetical protein n=1 Tax=Methylobacter luteus TaxID=415 RepID=UPI0004080507|nr:hypothetical protein [Methylobacter luteus]
MLSSGHQYAFIRTKQELQSIIAEQNKILAAAPSFAAKRAAQKAKLDAMIKMGLITNPEKNNANYHALLFSLII